MESALLLVGSAVILGLVWKGAIASRDTLHLIGIAGTIAMIVGQGYSARKRTGLFRSWRIKEVLEHHTTLGVAGPLLVLAHTGLEFDGVAGLSALLMTVVVASGFVGRYIYRRVPAREKEEELESLKKRLEEGGEDVEKDVEGLQRRIRDVERRLAYYRRMKRLLSNWRTLHIPLTALFFITVAIHIITIYYY